jgi:hypothetical protein
MERTGIRKISGRQWFVIAAVAAVMLGGGIGAAVAQTSGGSTSTTAPGAPGAKGPRGPGGPGGPGGRFRGGPAFGFGGGPGGSIHGEFVQPDGSGGYRTVDQQVGDVTSVSSSSISVKSADGFSKTYSVDQNTVVNAGRDGIGSVKNGDKVSVNAVVTNGQAAARSVQDQTTLGQIRQHWNPNAPQGGPQQGGPPTTRTS